MDDDLSDQSVTTEVDSEIFSDDADNFSPKSSSPKQSRRPLSGAKSDSIMHSIKPKIESIHMTLKGTNRNLHSVDRMLSSYRTVNESQLDSMERLRQDLNKTMDDLKEERVKSSLSMQQRAARDEDGEGLSRGPKRRSMRDYGSDSEYGGREGRSGAARGIRFTRQLGGSAEHLQEIHTSLRDLTQGHAQMKDALTSEIHRRNREDLEAKKNIVELSDSVRRTTHDTSSSVEKRLAAIQDELRSERRYTDQKRTEMGRLSTELRQALSGAQVQPPPPSVDDTWRQRLSSAELNRKQIESELEMLKRKFDQSEGSKTALMRQIDDLRNQLSSAERERTHLRNRVDEMKSEEDLRDKKRLKAAQEEKESERRLMEKEIEELKLALTRSSQQGSSELEEIKRILERTDRQKSQYHEQVDAMKKDMDGKEKYTLRLMDELQVLKGRHDECERQRNSAISQLEDAVRQLRDSTRDVSHLSDSLKSTESQLNEADKKNDELRLKAQESVKMWKLKCKRVEKDLEKLQLDTCTNQQRLDYHTNENETLKMHNHTISNQLDNIKREMTDILAIRAQQEEQIRLRENELCDTRGVRLDLEKEVRDYRCMVEKLKEEIHCSEVSLASIRDDKHHLDDKLSSVQASSMLAQDENKVLRKEMQELATHKAELNAQLNEVLNQRQESKRAINDFRRTEHDLREEIATLAKQIKEEGEYHQATVQEQKERMNQNKERNARTVQDLTHRLKRDKAEYEAQIQALKIEVGEERANGKILKRQEEKYKVELEKVHEQLNQYDDDNARLRRLLVKNQKEAHSKLQMADDDISRARKTEDDLYSLQESKRKQKRDFTNVLHAIGSEINGVVEAASFGAIEAYEAITSNRFLPNDTQGWLAEMKSKLQWLRSEILEHQTRERRLKLSVQDMVDLSEQDRRTLIGELQKKQDVVEELLDERDELEVRDMKKLDEVYALEEQVVELSESLKQQQEETFRRSMAIEQEKRHIANELRGIKDSQREKDLINERYERLQQKVNSLRQELSDTRHCATDYSLDKLSAERQIHRIDSIAPKQSQSPVRRGTSPIRRVASPILRGTSPVLRGTSPIVRSHSPVPRVQSPPLRSSSPYCRSKSPSMRRRVRISDSRAGGDARLNTSRTDSPTRDRSRSPPSRLRAISPMLSQKTPPPLDMSDDEFKNRFIPRSPRLTDSMDDC